jgi:hypothetical protein
MMLNPSAMARFLAVRAVRLGLVLVLSAMIALGVYITYPGNDAFRQTLTQMGLFDRAIDAQLDSVLDTMVASAEIGPSGEVFFDRPVGDARFLEPNSGFYWQVSGEGHEPFSSRSLGDRRLGASSGGAWAGPVYVNSDQLPGEPLRMVERSITLPGSDVEWQFVVARSREPN